MSIGWAPPRGIDLAEFPLNKLVPGEGERPSFAPYQDPHGRTIYYPNGPMRELQQGFAVALASVKTPMPFAHGGLRGRSISTNAQAHRDNRYLYITDISNAFGSLRVERVAKVLYRRIWQLRLWPLEMTEAWLQQWCFLPEGGLITGAASAPLLFNMYLAQTVGREFTWHRDSRDDYRVPLKGITFTHYMDDIVFSSCWPIGKTSRRRLREIVQAAGFEVAHHKSRYVDLAKGPVEIAGVMLELGGRTFPSKALRRRAEGKLAAALAGRISPAVAHGHIGACFAALPGPHAERINRPEVANIRRAQERLLRERPMGPRPTAASSTLETTLGPGKIELIHRSSPAWKEPSGSFDQLPLF